MNSYVETVLHRVYSGILGVGAREKYRMEKTDKL